MFGRNIFLPKTFSMFSDVWLLKSPEKELFRKIFYSFCCKMIYRRKRRKLFSTTTSIGLVVLVPNDEFYLSLGWPRLHIHKHFANSLSTTWTPSYPNPGWKFLRLAFTNLTTPYCMMSFPRLILSLNPPKFDQSACNL